MNDMRAILSSKPRSMWDFHELLPVGDRSTAVTLGEGATPLLQVRGLGCNLHLKMESNNPTGSQKDRALSVSITKARELGFDRVVIASTGSAGLSCAAYCARAQLPCVVLVPQGTPHERLLPMQVLGAVVIEMRGSFVEIERWLEGVRARGGWFDATTKAAANPFHFEGPKTIAYEIWSDLGQIPDWLVVPVGGGATLTGIWRGFREIVASGLASRTPRMASVQPARFNALERAMLAQAAPADLHLFAQDERVETVMRNLKHGVPPDGESALEAVRNSGGIAMSVEEEKAIEWQRRLGRQFGIFCEPSSSAAAAAVESLTTSGAIAPDQSVVALVTGSGLRETGSLAPLQLASIEPDEPPSRLDRLIGAAAHTI